jgi:hypothetical protein
MRGAGPLGSVLDGNGANVALCVNVQNGAVIEIACLSNRSVPKLNEQSVSVGKVANFHGTNLRSKKAMDGLSVRQQDNPKVPTFHLWYANPPPNSTIGLAILP